MKAFFRLFAATLAMMAIFALGGSLILLVSWLAFAYFGPLQGLVALALAMSLAVTGLIHWSEQDSFPYRF